MTLSERLKTELKAAGASLVGLADLRGLSADQRKGFNYGISIAVAIESGVINGIGNGPTKEYFDEYIRLNRLLDSLDIKAAELIKDSGFNALPLTRANVNIDYQNHSTILPHKTVATRAGLGWIGKCALLVTEKYGSAIRISSVLTDAPLEVGKAINQSHCGQCNICVSNCPAEALSGDLWSVGMKREVFYDGLSCRKNAIERTWNISQGETHCGLCILVCPKTRSYIISSGSDYDFPSVDIALKGDMEEILDLQKLAFQSQAELYNDYSLPAMVQTLNNLKEEAKDSIILKVVEARKIVGSVRAREKYGVCYIGKLVVHPDYRNRGIGKKLMEAIEGCFEGVRFELFTGHLSEKNLALYGRLGYRRFKTESIAADLLLIYMEKKVMV
ncbi:MAG TPA: GNAT family N-acetyltransferase [Syntrophomonadaceae bacterium]|nr:GNAT family N-acetyltransferase [Syntrophomonadaceae bacterium]